VRSPSHPPLPQISAKDSFEIAYNAACGLVEAGQLPAAEEQLQLALRVGELAAAGSTMGCQILPTWGGLCSRGAGWAVSQPSLAS
jgi:hypothetical protein